MKLTATRDVKVTRWRGGVGAGRYGITCYQAVGGGDPPQMSGLSLERVLGVELHEGAVVRLTATVLRPGRRRQNPWRTTREWDRVEPRPSARRKGA